MFIQISDNLKQLSTFFPENLYIVGGYVRNKLMGIDESDVDITSSVDIEEVSKRLKESQFSVKIKSLKFGSLLISKDGEEYEYTVFRKDIYEDDGRHAPTRVERTDSIVVDSNRRDFAINAIYYNINKDEIVDIHHGMVDLFQRIIRCDKPDEVLKYDGERILRMVRIAGELDFRIDKQTLACAEKYASNIKAISGNRKKLEIEKILHCDKRYNLNKGSLKRALRLLNKLNVWQYFGLKEKKVKYQMVYKVENRMLGLLIDIVDTEQPACLQAFLEKWLSKQMGLEDETLSQYIKYLSGYYHALEGMKNKEYFFRYFDDWNCICPLLAGKSKRIQNKYNFFYKYIIEHNLLIKVEDLKIDELVIKKSFPKIDPRSYGRILTNLLSKVFDGKLQNQKASLLNEIKKNLQNY